MRRIPPPDINQLALELINYFNGGSTGGVGLNNGIEYFTITAQNLLDKSITLAATPDDPTEVNLCIYKGIDQQAGVDFVVNDKVISWNGLALELLLEEGNRVQVTYGVLIT